LPGVLKRWVEVLCVAVRVVGVAGVGERGVVGLHRYYSAEHSGMWQLACALVLLPLAAAGNEAYEEMDIWSEGAGSASWGPDDIAGYKCVDSKYCDKVLAPAVAEFKGLAECQKTCSPDGQAAKHKRKTAIVVIVAVVVGLVIAVCAWSIKKCRNPGENDLQRSLNRGIQKDSLDDPSSASW
jgi:hypothetical protein